MLRMNILSRHAQSAATTATQPNQDRKTQTKLCRFVRALVLPLGIAAVAVPLLTPKPAEAWWRGGVWISGPAYVPYVYTPPVYNAAPPVYMPPTHWVPAHYNWRGFWVPGHWAP